MGNNVRGHRWSWLLDRGFLSDSLSVIAERLMEWGQLADAALDEIGALGMMQWKEAGLLGDTHGLRSVRELPQDCLAADDHDRIVVGDDRGSADEMLELVSGHGPCRKRSRVSRQIFQRSRGRSAPAKGLDWRSSVASSLRSTRKAAIEAASPCRTSAHFRA